MVIVLPVVLPTSVPIGRFLVGRFYVGRLARLRLANFFGDFPIYLTITSSRLSKRSPKRVGEGTRVVGVNGLKEYPRGI